MTSAQQAREHAVVEALFHALTVGCLAPVPYPNPKTAPVEEWVRWDALHRLHEAVVALEHTLFQQLLEDTELEWERE